MTTPRRATAQPRKKTAAKDNPLTKAAARAALDRATKRLVAMQRDVNLNAWSMGRVLLQIAELELHRARGFASMEVYVDERLGVSPAVMFQCMRIAGAYSEEVARAYSPEKLDRALRYIAATPADEAPRDVPTLDIPVVGDDGSMKKVPFERATVAQIRKATANEKAEAKPKRRKQAAPTGDARREWLQATHAALDASVGKKLAAEASVALRARSGGDVLVVEVPWSAATAGLRAVAKSVPTQ
jgi:hypothetical protein